MSKKIINYVNGVYDSAENSIISIYDPGFMNGYGVFDFLRTYNRKPFLLDEHLNRLSQSIRLSGLNETFTMSDVRNIIFKLLELNPEGELTFRIIVTPGVDEKNSCIYVIVGEFLERSKEIYTDGVKLVIDDFQRSYPRIKSLNYFNFKLKKALVKEQQAFSLLYVHNQKVLECAQSNIFIVKNGKITTPVEGVLLGVTRNKILDLISGKYDVEEKEITFDQLKSADEVFITATTQAVIPVVKINYQAYSNGKPGKITQEIIRIYNDFVNSVSAV